MWLLMLMVVLAPPLETVTVDRDNVEIRRSCRLRVVGPIQDTDGNGVIQIIGDGITVEGADQHLHGSRAGQAPETFSGYGVRITGRRVTLRNLKVSGYKGGIFASGAHGLHISGCDVSNNFRQKLLSTPEAENLADWLYPHDNDNNEWLTKWGAGIYVEATRKATIDTCYARDGQNGLCLRDVHETRVFDNDFSYLSGWGIALYRSSDNIISHNAVDFCIRGYSDGVYARGQDSAGILLFEQCSRNMIGHNSGTHGGDGFFGFGGKSALEGKDAGPGVGCNENVIFSNDFSDAAANAVEITFSFDNAIVANKLNRSHYGIWGGYSSRGSVISNQIVANTIAGVAVEHGHEWELRRNLFERNRRGVQLWWDDDRDLLGKPWSKVNPTDCRDHLVLDNRFKGDEVGVELRGGATAAGRDNDFVDVRTETDVDTKSSWQSADAKKAILPTAPQVPGGLRPVGRLGHLDGRHTIVMTEYGPYAHDLARPFARRLIQGDGSHLIEVYGRTVRDAEGAWQIADLKMSGDVTYQIGHAEGDPPSRRDAVYLRIWGGQKGKLVPYRVSFTAGDKPFVFEGTVGLLDWDVRYFKSPVDPREDFTTWNQATKGGVAERRSVLDLAFRGRGPSQLHGASEAVRAGDLPVDRFGTVAETEVLLPPGTWLLETISDDGVRVWCDGAMVIDNWTHHGPTRDAARVTLDRERVVRLHVLHFELDGYAQLRFGLRRVE